MNNNIYQFKHVTKYASVPGVLDTPKVFGNVSFTLKKGNSIGFIIEDEAIRTLFYKLIGGIECPDSGKILLYDKDTYFDGYPYKGMGVMLDEPSFINTYDGFSNLKMLSEYEEIFENDRISKTMSFVGLDPLSETKVCNYSSESVKKLCLAYALIPNKELLVIHEPFKHLNEYALSEFFKIYTVLRSKKTIIYVSESHSYLQHLCDTIYYFEGDRFNKCNYSESTIIM